MYNSALSAYVRAGLEIEGVVGTDELGLVVQSSGFGAGRMRFQNSISQSALPLAIQEREQPPAYLNEEVW